MTAHSLTSLLQSYFKLNSIYVMKENLLSLVLAITFLVGVQQKVLASHDAHSLYEEQSKIYQDPYINEPCQNCTEGCPCKEHMDTYPAAQDHHHLKIWRGN